MEKTPRKRSSAAPSRVPAGATFGAVVTVRDLDEAAELSNRAAPEHLELCVADPPEALAERITHAGAIFLGQMDARGDRRLHRRPQPTSCRPHARPRFSSGLSVLDFMKRTTLAQIDNRAALKAIGPAAETLARSESLEAHGLSVRAKAPTA